MTAAGRLSGNFHRARWLALLVKRAAANPSYERSRAIDRSSGTVAQQFPFARPKLRRARRLASGDARAVLDALLAWDGSYHRTYEMGLVHEGVAIWEELKDRAERSPSHPRGELATERISGGPQLPACAPDAGRSRCERIPRGWRAPQRRRPGAHPDASERARGGLERAAPL